MSTALFTGADIFAKGSSAILGAKATADQASAAVKEETRQQQRSGEIAAEKKSDRAREADIALGTLIASHSDTGATINAIARGAGNVGAIEGLDKARIESNRAEFVGASRARQLSTVKSAKYAIAGQLLSFFGDSSAAIGKVYGGASPADKSTPVGGSKTPGGSGPQFTGKSREAQGSF